MLDSSFDDWSEDTDILPPFDLDELEESDKAKSNRLKVARRRQLEEILEAKRLEASIEHYDDDDDIL